MHQPQRHHHTQQQSSTHASSTRIQELLELFWSTERQVKILETEVTELSEQYSEALQVLQDARRTEIKDLQYTIDLLIETPPASCAQEDRHRRRTMILRPLTNDEWILYRQRRWLRRLWINAIGALLPFIVQNEIIKIQLLRKRIRTCYDDELRQARSQKISRERALEEQHLTSYERAIQHRLSSAKQSLQMKQFQSEQYQAQLRGHGIFVP